MNWKKNFDLKENRKLKHSCFELCWLASTIETNKSDLCTVCFFTIVIFYDDIISRVMKIFEFWQKFLKAYGNAFNDVQLPGFFYNNLGLRTNMERDVIIFKLSLSIKFSFWLFPFKLLSFLNKLSYIFQIGLKWKLFWSSFWECLRWNVQLMF